MAMDPKAFLDFAQSLIKGKNEEHFRTSVSRSYYGLYNHIALSLESMGHPLPPDANGHKKAVHYLRNCNVKAVEDIASPLEDLRLERNSADYDMNLQDFDNSKALFTFIKAEEAYNNFKTNTSNRRQKNKLSREIMLYKQKINES